MQGYYVHVCFAIHCSQPWQKDIKIIFRTKQVQHSLISEVTTELKTQIYDGDILKNQNITLTYGYTYLSLSLIYMLKFLPIIPSSTSHKIYQLFSFFYSHINAILFSFH